MSAETILRLRRHAGFDGATESSSLSVSNCTSPADDRDGRLEEAVVDFMAVLSRLNHELNGPVPSESSARSKVIPTDVVYAVAEVARMLRQHAEKQHDPAASRAAWLVDTSWLGVLAGDIDDLGEHLKEEDWARGG